MTIYELTDRVSKIDRCIDALAALTTSEGVHGLDNELLKEEMQELVRARYDHIREFEAECIARGKLDAALKCEKHYGGILPESLCDEINKSTRPSR